MRPDGAILWNCAARAKTFALVAAIALGVFATLLVAAGKDPLDFRRALLKDKPDFLAVLDKLADKAEWGKAMPKGAAQGVAIHESFGTIVGEVVEVRVTAEGLVISPHRSRRQGWREAFAAAFDGRDPGVQLVERGLERLRRLRRRHQGEVTAPSRPRTSS